MQKIINYENIRNFAYVNDKVVKHPIKGVALSFVGLGSTDMWSGENEAGEYYGDRGILFIVPYTNPWSWMNKQAVTYTDEILDVLFEKYGLGSDIPVVSTGGSMGGLSALVYAAYAKRTPVAVVANCPVCDAVYHYTERGDLPRTFYSALYFEEGTMEDALQTVSPLHLLDKLPHIAYRIIHCDADQAVNLDRHSRTLVKEMSARGFDVTLDVVPDRGHCNLPYKMKRRYADYIVGAVENFVQK